MSDVYKNCKHVQFIQTKRMDNNDKYIKPELDVPKNKEWQKQISKKRVQSISSGANCHKSSNIIK